MVRFWREKARVLGFVGSPLIFWLVIGSGFGNLGFFFPGMLTLTVMTSAVFSAMSLIEDRREGFLLSMLVSPAPRSSMVFGKVSGAATLAWVQGLLFLLFLPITPFRPSPLALAELAAVLFLIAFSFTSLGFLLAWKLDSTQAFHGVANLLLFPLWMVSGALFPAANAHGWIRWVTTLNPLTYALALLRGFLDPTAPDLPSAPMSLAITIVCALALWTAASVVASQRRSGAPK